MDTTYKRDVLQDDGRKGNFTKGDCRCIGALRHKKRRDVNKKLLKWLAATNLDLN